MSRSVKATYLGYGSLFCYLPVHAWEIFSIFSIFPALQPPNLLRVSSYSFVSDTSEKLSCLVSPTAQSALFQGTAC